MFSIEKRSDLKLKPPKFKCDVPIAEGILEPLPNRSFFWTLIGPPGSGKTSLLVSLLTNPGAYKGKFDNVVIVMPPNSVASLTSEPIKRHDKIYPELDYETLEGVYTKAQKASDDKETTLLVLDDCAAALKDKDIQRLLRLLIWNRRHLRLSIVLLSQSWIALPLSIRKSVSHFSLARFANKKEYAAMLNEVIFLEPEKADRLMEFVFDAPYNFLFVDVMGGRYFKNLDAITMPQ